jgi:hypothetical protein
MSAHAMALKQRAAHGTVEALVGVVGRWRQDGHLVAQALAFEDLPVQNRVLTEPARALRAGHEEGVLAAARLLAQGLEEGAQGERAGQALGAAGERAAELEGFLALVGQHARVVAVRTKGRGEQARAKGVHGRQPDGAAAHIGRLGPHRDARGARGARPAKHVEKRLQAGHVARVGTVLVELEHEDRAVAHDFLGVAEQEAVWTAGEVGQVDHVHDVALGRLLQRGQDLLAVAPEGIAVALAQTAQLGPEEVHGQHGAAEIRDLLRQPQVRTGVVHVVGTTDEKDELFVVLLGLGQKLGALGEAALFELGLGHQARLPRLLDLARRKPELLGKPVGQGLDDFALAHAHVDQRGQHAGGIEVVHHQGRARGGGGTLHERTHRGAAGFLVGGRVLDVGNEDEIDAVLGCQLGHVAKRELGREAEVGARHARAELADLVGGLPR